jgi:hypothetical protein
MGTASLTIRAVGVVIRQVFGIHRHLGHMHGAASNLRAMCGFDFSL